MRRKPKIKYTDMCIYVDTNINKENADSEKIYDYLVMLSYMLAVKRHFFNREDYYDRFANYFATIIYNRMTDKRQFLPEDDPNWISPIKSCLNYMKQIIYARKCAFCYEEFDFTTKPSDAEQFNAFKDYLYQPIGSNSQELISIEADSYLNDIDKIVKRKIYSGVYGKDPILAWKLYTAVILSLLRNFTLSNKNKHKLIDFRKTNEYNESHADCRMFTKNNYEDLLTAAMLEETADAPIAFNLPEKYLDYVAVVLQQVKQEIIKDIHDLILEYSVSDDLVEDILMTSLSDEESI